MVKKTYDRVISVMERLESTASTSTDGSYPYKLVLGVRNGRVQIEDPEPVMAMVSGGMDRTKRKALKSAVGVMMLGVVQPGKKSWLYATRLLALSPVAAAVPEGMKVVEHPTKRKIAMAVASFARYPVGLLSADPAQTAAVLDLRRKFKMYRAAGVFHARGAGAVEPLSDHDTRFLDL